MERKSQTPGFKSEHEKIYLNIYLNMGMAYTTCNTLTLSQSSCGEIQRTRIYERQNKYSPICKERHDYNNLPA